MSHPLETLPSNTREGTELIIAFVAAVGVNLEIAEQAVKRQLTKRNYCTEEIKVTRDVLTKLDSRAEDNFSSTYDRIRMMMQIGTDARVNISQDIIAKGIAAEIAARRRQNGKRDGRVAYMVHSLKNPEEVLTLRKIYPRGFYLIGVHAHPDRRKSHLVNTRKMTEREAVSLMERDKKETDKKEVGKKGQQVNDTFHLADFFVGWGGDDDLTLEDFFTDSPEAFEPTSSKPNARRVASSINRFIDLIFGDPFKTPAFGEHAMYLAFSASLRSADLSRQVGAVIARDGEILSTGANDCPMAGGGLYWPEFDSESGEFEDTLDGRDYMRRIDESRRGYDSNRFEQEELIKTLHSMAVKAKMGSEALMILNEVLSSPQSPIRSLTEYGRVVHAEMEALLACARKGISTKGATIYCTTFPCHNCAKHIIAAGIDRVVFIEPYLKSKAFEFHKEAMKISYPQDRPPGKRKPNELVQFEPFFGVGPRRFFDLFSMSHGTGEQAVRKIEATGEKADWPTKGQFQARLKMEPKSYVDQETEAAQEFQTKVQELPR